MKEKINKVYREFGLTSLSVDSSTTIFLLVFMIVSFGFNAYQTMPKESFPEVVLPTIYIGTVYPGNSGVDMENLVTRYIEKEVKSVQGIDDITSTSIQDFSTIIVKFDTDVPIEEALQDVKDAVDKAKPDLPNDLPSDPDVFEINFSEMPIMSINLSGDFKVDELRGYAEYLQDKIERYPEISEIKIKGALDREVRIDVDAFKMEARQVSFQDIEQAIGSENLTLSGGEFLSNEFRRNIRIEGEYKNIEEIRNTIVKNENSSPVYLRDIATVKMDFEDPTSYARSDKLPVVSLDVIKRAGQNLLSVADKIKALLDDPEANQLPPELKVQIFNDQSVVIRDQVSNLENSIISGVILVVLVLLFFLGTRNATFVGVAIPLSMLMGILILQTLGVTLNMVVLFALILALGMLVDNAIVVVENIYRYMQEGYSNIDAAKKGTGEVALPIIASTATTLAAFIPLAFWPGIMGSFMKYLPITLIIVLSSSLFVALVINPVITAAFMSLDEQENDPKARRRKVRNMLIFLLGLVIVAVLAHIGGATTTRNIFAMSAIIGAVNFFLFRPLTFFFQNIGLPFVENLYDKFVRVVLYKYTPIFIFIGSFAMLIGAGMLLGANAPKTILFPTADPTYVNVFVELPMGSDIEATNEFLKELEENITETVAPYDTIIDAILTQIGEGTGDPSSPPEPGSSPNKARMTISFISSDKRGDVSSMEVMEKIRESVQGYAGVQLIVDQNQDGPPTGKPINLEIRGDNMIELVLLSDKIQKYLVGQNIPGVEELQKDVKVGKPELKINIDREAARRFGLSTRSVAMTIRTALFGKEVSKFKQGEDEFPIQLRLGEKYRTNIDALLNQRVTFRNTRGQINQVPISAVADIEYTSTYSSVKRKDLEKAITIYSNVLDSYNPNEVVAEVDAAMANYEMPEGYTYELTGEQKEQEEAMAFLGSAFTIALFCIFLIIVAQFNSIMSPFIILLSILFSTIGVLLGYAFTGMDLVIVMTGVGIISLAGIVVNNAIVLIDYIELVRKRRRSELGLAANEELPHEEIRTAIVQAGKTRLRPVLLTAITTVLGLIPLAIGFNFNFATFLTDLDPQIFIGGDNVAMWGPMAWTVIYGLVFATFLTLIVVPVMYWLSYRMTDAFLNLIGYGKKKYEGKVAEEELVLEDVKPA